MSSKKRVRVELTEEMKEQVLRERIEYHLAHPEDTRGWSEDINGLVESQPDSDPNYVVYLRSSIDLQKEYGCFGSDEGSTEDVHGSSSSESDRDEDEEVSCEEDGESRAGEEKEEEKSDKAEAQIETSSKTI